MSAYDDPSMYRWTEMNPDAAAFTRGYALGVRVRILDATRVVAEGLCTGIRLVGELPDDVHWRIVLDGRPHVVPRTVRVFAAVPIPAVPRHPQPTGPVVSPPAAHSELETTLAEARAARDAAQACAEEAAALLEAARADGSDLRRIRDGARRRDSRGHRRLRYWLAPRMRH